MVSGSPRGAGVSLLVDARGLYSSGIGRYLREVLKAVTHDPRFGEITLAGTAEEVERFRGSLQPGSDRIRTVDYRGAYYTPAAQHEWVTRVAPSVLTDVTFFPHYDVPLLRMPPRSVVTVHDLIHYKVPQLFAWWRRAAGAVLLNHAVKKAARVLTVSNSTATDLDERYPGSAAKTVVIYHGVPEGFSPPLAGEAEAERSEVGGPFVLCVGNRKPHKNLRTAIQTFAAVRSTHPELRLVLAGRPDGGWEETRLEAADLGLHDTLVDVGEVSDQRLRSLYGAAEALLFPSLYEGFGLPLLEAMACGCPVIASNSSSMPEVVGDAGFMSDPHDVDGFVRALETILDDPKERYLRRERALGRARRFSLEESGRMTADAIYATAAARVTSMTPAFG